jgi:hypothetical protein
MPQTKQTCALWRLFDSIILLPVTAAVTNIRLSSWKLNSFHTNSVEQRRFWRSRGTSHVVVAKALIRLRSKAVLPPEACLERSLLWQNPLPVCSENACSNSCVYRIKRCHAHSNTRLLLANRLILRCRCSSCLSRHESCCFGLILRNATSVRKAAFPQALSRPPI